jgi:hypothetical protein
MAILVIDTDLWSYLRLDVPLITHNRNHFIGVDGLKIISESGR